ncbi:hypothetical protein ACVWZZ_008548 [Bradyrhizobium sp. LM6.10]
MGRRLCDVNRSQRAVRDQPIFRALSAGCVVLLYRTYIY